MGKKMNNMVYVESVEPGAVVLTDDAEPMEGNRALLNPADVGALIRLLSGNRFLMQSTDGEFSLWRSASEEDPYDYMGTICGEEFGLSLSCAQTLECALRQASLELMRTRT